MYGSKIGAGNSQYTARKPMVPARPSLMHRHPQSGALGPQRDDAVGGSVRLHPTLQRPPRGAVGASARSPTGNNSKLFQTLMRGIVDQDGSRRPLSMNLADAPALLEENEDAPDQPAGGGGAGGAGHVSAVYEQYVVQAAPPQGAGNDRRLSPPRAPARKASAGSIISVPNSLGGSRPGSRRASPAHGVRRGSSSVLLGKAVVMQPPSNVIDFSVDAAVMEAAANRLYLVEPRDGDQAEGMGRPSSEPPLPGAIDRIADLLGENAANSRRRGSCV